MEALLRPLERYGVRLGLESLQVLLGRLGDPHLRFPVVLVAGTNGKGSCAAFLAAALGEAGYRAGLYTSPHLEDVAERIRIDGLPADDAELVAAVEAVLGAAPPEPTWFEAVTAAALVVFARCEVDLAVLEVGLGGRLDATNVTAPVVSVISPVALDHQSYLGTTLEAIAGEKAGVLRAGRPGVVWVAQPQVRRVLERRAAALGAPLRLLPQELRIEAAGTTADGHPRVRLATRRSSYLLESSLLGDHQLGNLALAAVAAEELANAGFHRLDAAAVEEGARRCHWPGRLEEVALPDGRRVLLDGAHNPAAAENLAAHLRSSPSPPDLLFGALAEKDAPAMLSALAPLCRQIVLTSPPGHRAHPPAELAAGLPRGSGIVEESLEPALDRALSAGAPRLVVTGSLYLVGAVRTSLRTRFGVPPPAREIPIWERRPPVSQSAQGLGREGSAGTAPGPAPESRPAGSPPRGAPGPDR